MEDITELLARELPGAVELRHALHADPRASGDEEDTAVLLGAAIGGVAQRVATTGRMIRLGPATGPAVVLRAELDGLPVREESALDWASPSGIMHACGHDVHCAALVAVARAAREVDLPAGLLVLLQPREERAPSGAVDVLADPAFTAHRPAAMVGVHVQPELARGRVGAAPGPVNAGGDVVEVTVSGRGGHAAYPHRTTDPVLATAQIVVALNHLVSRRVDPLHSVVLSIGQLHAGTAPNIIPETARLSASLRTLDPADREPVRAAIRTTVAGVAQAYGCTAETVVIEMDPTLANDPALAAATAPELAALDLTPAAFRSCGSDDFARYTERIPSIMLFLGTGDGTPGAPGLHHPRFVPPDDVVAEVARTYLAGYRGALRTLGLAAPRGFGRPDTDREVG